MTEHTEITEHTESRTQQGLKLFVSSVISVCSVISLFLDCNDN